MHWLFLYIQLIVAVLLLIRLIVILTNTGEPSVCKNVLLE